MLPLRGFCFLFEYLIFKLRDIWLQHLTAGLSCLLVRQMEARTMLNSSWSLDLISLEMHRNIFNMETDRFSLCWLQTAFLTLEGTTYADDGVDYLPNPVVNFVCGVFYAVCSPRHRLWRISATYHLSRGGRNCSRRSMNSTRSSRKKRIRGETVGKSESVLHACVDMQRAEWHFIWQYLCSSIRDALNKMKDVYEKNPQMGDPNSLQPKISETMSNIQRLRSEIHRNEVQEESRTGSTF